MPRINHEVRAFIIKGHAELLSPREIIRAVKGEFGVSLSNQQVYAYDPTSPKCAEKWKKIHAELRHRFLNNISEIPIANLAFQLQTLQDALDRLTENPKSINEVEVRNTLIAAAKLVGGIYSSEGKQHF
jgi:hypothetical protein